MDTACTADELVEHTQALEAGLKGLPTHQRFRAATLEAVYSMAYHLLQQGQHERAMHYFAFLTLYAPTDARHIAGLATTHQRAGNHARALHLFSLASYLQPQRPIFALRMAECFLRLEGYAAARALLDRVVRHCRESGAHEAVRTRAQAMLDVLTHAPATA
jgi:type III secretion system low calcium response chaperone LcrH/SycD